MQNEVFILDSRTPCLTLRWNTERPITLKELGGACVLVGNNVELIRKEYRTALAKVRTPIRPELWDGHTVERCLQAILNASSTRHCESDEGGRGNPMPEASLRVGGTTTKQSHPARDCFPPRTSRSQ